MCYVQELILNNDLKQVHHFLAQINLLILGLIMPEALLDWNILPSYMVNFQQPTLILFSLGKYIHLKVVDFQWPKIFRNWHLCIFVKCLFITKLLVNAEFLIIIWFKFFPIMNLPNNLLNFNQIIIKSLEI